jgi:uncharacterized BrkB/YihY/UPF0761 family membrane protein
VFRTLSSLDTRDTRDTQPQRRPIWTDRWSIALALLGLGLNAAFALFLWQSFETFPELIALHFNAFGEADLIGSKTEIYKLPLIGAIIWGSNAVLAVVSSPHDRVLARAALGVSLFVQTLICLGAWRILT